MNRRDLFKGILGLTGALALGKQVAPQPKTARFNPKYLDAYTTSGSSRVTVSSYIITDTRGRIYSTQQQTWADNT